MREGATSAVFIRPLCGGEAWCTSALSEWRACWPQGTVVASMTHSVRNFERLA